MASTNFVNGVTLTDADWFNDVDRVVYDIMSDPADASDIRTALAVLGTAGGTMTGFITLHNDPTSALHAATKQYVDNAVATGLSPTASCATATTANITLSGEQTIDGVLTSASRVLVKNQSSAPANGIYVSASGAWSRATDMDAWSEVPGRYTFVTGGSTQANTGWSCNSPSGGTIDVSDVNWVQFSNPGSYTAGTGLTLDGTEFSVDIGTDVQAFDAGLDSIAGLTTAANKMIYTTGSDTYAVTDLSATARTLLDDTSTSAMRTTLGLAIGTDVQAYDAELAALAGLTSAANKLPYFTGSGTADVTDLSAAGRALIDDANASAQRTTLGLAIGTDVQAYDAGLASIAGLTTAADKMIYTTALDTYATADLTAAARTVLDDTSVANMVNTLGGASSTGTGGLVRATSPTLVTPALGTPASGDLSNCTGYPVSATLPAGIVLPFAGTSAPTGFLLCYGQAVSRTTYSDLFSAISTTYGTGDGSTTFNLPDLRGRVVAGKDDMGSTSANRLTDQSGGLDGDVLGDTGGSETHALVTDEMPAHTHSFGRWSAIGSGIRVVAAQASADPGDQATTSTGGGGAHNNVQPTIILNYIIKT